MVTILTGISGSGKSTYAQKNAGENTVVINRDNIRRELTGEESLSEYFVNGMDRFLEEQVTKIEHHRFAFALSQGKDVIIDNTNLEKRFVKEYLKIAIDFGLNIHQIDVQAFPIDIDDAYQRVCERDKTPIAYKVLENQLARFLNGWDLTKLYTEVLETHEPKKWYFPKFPVEKVELNPDLPPIVICDLDGTLSHRAVLKFPKPHMRSYYNTIEYSTDEPDAFLTPILTALMEKTKIFFVTGRKSVTREDTIRFLEKTFPDFKLGEDYELITRDETIDKHNGNDDPDDLVKYRIFNEYIRDKYNVLGVFDDRRKVVALWQALGLRVANMGLLNEEF